MANVNAGLASVAAAVAQLNPIMGSIVTLITTYRAIRDAAKANNPTDPATQALPDDATLISMLLAESKLLQADAATLKQWLQTQVPPTPPAPTGGSTPTP
jgi:hypothetical protein